MKGTLEIQQCNPHFTKKLRTRKLRVSKWHNLSIADFRPELDFMTSNSLIVWDQSVN